jgi:hypothetical protein
MIKPVRSTAYKTHARGIAMISSFVATANPSFCYSSKLSAPVAAVVACGVARREKRPIAMS